MSDAAFKRRRKKPAAEPAEKPGKELVPLGDQQEIVRLFQNYKDSYTANVKVFVSWLARRPINQQTIEEYFQWLKTAALAPNSVNIYMSAVVKRVRQWARLQGLDAQMKVEGWIFTLRQNPDTKPFPPSHRIHGAEYMVTPEEYAFLRAYMAEHQSCERVGALIDFLWATGCRITETLMVKHADCKEINDKRLVKGILVPRHFVRVTLRHTKFGKQRDEYFSTALYHRIIEVYHGKTWLFETRNGTHVTRGDAEKQVAKLGKRAFDRRLAPHDFRRAFVTNQHLLEGKSIKLISRYIGHVNVSTTMTYYLQDEAEPEDVISAADLGEAPETPAT